MKIDCISLLSLFYWNLSMVERTTLMQTSGFRKKIYNELLKLCDGSSFETNVKKVILRNGFK